MTLQTLDAMQAALRKTTETLARELAHPTDITPQWSNSEWLVARAVAAMHGVSPLLLRALRWSGPKGWADFLRDQSTHTENRHERIQELSRRIDEHARESSVPLVALKGAALHAIGVYAGGERPMADIDLLVRDDDAPRAIRLLQGLGFHETLSMWKHRVFEPNEKRAPASFAEHSANSIKIELHNRIGEMLPVRLAEITEIVWPREPRPGLNAYPSSAALMSHLLLHAAGAMAFRALRLLQLHDISRLAARMTDSDWDELLAGQTARIGMPWWSFPPLELTARYCSSASGSFASDASVPSSNIPQRVLAATAAACPRLLRQFCQRQSLSDVSYSQLRISAFPGIEWVRSVPELLVYVRQRVVPSAEAVACRKYLATTQPGLSASAWGHMSQGRRMLRWMASRPARPETLFAVRTALAQSNS